MTIRRAKNLLDPCRSIRKSAYRKGSKGVDPNEFVVEKIVGGIFPGSQVAINIEFFSYFCFPITGPELNMA